MPPESTSAAHFSPWTQRRRPPRRLALSVAGRVATRAEAERLAHRGLADLPDEAVVVEVQQCRRRQQAGQDAAGGRAGNRARQVVQCAIRRDEADVQAGQAPASAEQEPRKRADARIAVDAIDVEDPHDRQVLHVVEDLEQRDADEHVRDGDVAVPPERHAHREQRELRRALPLAAQPAPGEASEKRHRDDRRRERPRDRRRPTAPPAARPHRPRCSNRSTSFVMRVGDNSTAAPNQPMHIAMSSRAVVEQPSPALAS